MQPGPHADLLRDALEVEGEGQRALLAGDLDRARELLLSAVETYRASWEVAPPESYGRLVGMLKAAVLAGEPGEAARYAVEQLPAEPSSPASAYALAIAALVIGDDETTARAAGAMRGANPPFERAADAIGALATGAAEAYAAAVQAIVEDFEQRDEHLTGVPIADTALMLERLAEPRGLAARPRSVVLP